MAGHSVGTIFAEIDLDFTPYTRAQKRLLKDATSTTLNIEKSYKDLGIRSAKEFDLMRAKIQNAYDRITKDAKTSASDIIRAEKAKSAQLKKINEEQFGHQKSMLASMKQNWLAYTAAITAAYLVVRRVARGIGEVVEAARKQEDAQRRLEAVLAATGHAAGITGKQMFQMASDLQRITTVGDETIIAGQAILATFKEIKGDVFRDATMAALDMSEVMQQDLKSSIVQIGKALNDPTLGVSALTRVGVQFTEQQKEQIKTLHQSGDMLGAQAAILKELQSQFGGAATAARSTFGGALKSLNNAIGDFKERLGSAITQNERWVDIIGKLEAMLLDPDFLRGIQDLAINLAEIAASIASIAKYAGLRSIMGTFGQAVELSKQGLLDLTEFTKLGFVERQRLVDDILAKQKKIYHQIPPYITVTPGASAPTSPVGKPTTAKASKTDLDGGASFWEMHARDRYEVMSRVYDYELAEEQRLADAKALLWTDYSGGWEAQIKERYEVQSRGLDALIEAESNALAHLAELSERTFDAMQENFSGLFYDAITGELSSLRDYASAIFDSILKAWSDMMGQMAAQALFGQSGAGGWFQALLGGGSGALVGAGGTTAMFMHGGGTVGQDGVARQVPSSLFHGAPRLHNGLRAGEFPAVLERGEQVIPKGGGATATNVNITIHAVDAKSVQELLTNNKGLITGMVGGEMLRNGALRSSVRTAAR